MRVAENLVRPEGLYICVGDVKGTGSGGGTSFNLIVYLLLCRWGVTDPGSCD